MSLPLAVVPQLVVDLVLLGLGIGFAPRAFRVQKNRAVVVTLAVLGVLGLCVNLTGHTIDGFLQGGQIHDVRGG